MKVIKKHRLRYKLNFNAEATEGQRDNRVNSAASAPLPSQRENYYWIKKHPPAAGVSQKKIYKSGSNLLFTKSKTLYQEISPK
jgi:hypothetical protein